MNITQFSFFTKNNKDEVLMIFIKKIYMRVSFLTFLDIDETEIGDI